MEGGAVAGRERPEFGQHVTVEVRRVRVVRIDAVFHEPGDALAGAAVQRDLRGLCGVAVSQQEVPRVAGHRDIVPAVSRGQRRGLAPRAVVEIGHVELPLERRLLRRHEVDLAAPLVDAAYGRRIPFADHVPVARGHRALQHAAVVVPVQVIVAAALRGPEDLAPFRQEVEVVVQVHPAVAALREELARFAAGDGVGEDIQPLLVACLPLHQQAVALRVPFDAREVAVLAPEVAVGRRAGIQREDRELHLGVRASGRGIALLEDAHAAGVDLEALDLVDRRLVDARVGEVLLVRRPPVAGVTPHLLLRDELGDAVAQEPAAARRKAALGAGRDFDCVNVLVAHEADVAAARRELRVRLEGRCFGQPPHGLARGLRKIVVVKVPRKRDEQAPGVGRPMVVDDAAQCRDALALAPGLLLGGELFLGGGEYSRIDKQAMRLARHVPGPQVEDRRRIVAAAQVADELAVRRKAHLAKRRTLQVGRVEQSLDRQVACTRLRQAECRRHSEHQ